MVMFSNGFSTLQMPEDFEQIPPKDEFTDMYLVNTKIPMSIKFSTTPTLSGLPEIMNGIEENLKNNDKIQLVTSDFIVINESLYYMVVSSFNDGEKQIRRNEFLYVEDDNLYIFEFTYPYADRELDDFYLNVIRSLKIIVPKYIVENGSYRLNKEWVIFFFFFFLINIFFLNFMNLKILYRKMRVNPNTIKIIHGILQYLLWFKKLTFKLFCDTSPLNQVEHWK